MYKTMGTRTVQLVSNNCAHASVEFVNVFLVQMISYLILADTWRVAAAQEITVIIK